MLGKNHSTPPIQSSILILLCLVSIAAACPGQFGMMGGGGGCGCSAPPPPSSCGCGGRKKRSLPEKPTFFGIAAGDDNMMCNDPELKKIILENMQSTSVDSSKAVNGALEAKQLNRFVVVCSENGFVFTVRADTAYCGARKNEHNCHAFSM
ncbi:Protein CBG01300 [Caenorhabditis briggsae]|uniref:Protein CBG01300 n=1 Tax=Caenorhabditis briggsae TaxID=6238 RepID=A8WQ30_CAEBR|nr:Protein CBG01300 [Caenorhabditis briggsae]CAP22588.1 Protein CBG01300 [Caenorhabditis briggsae]